MPSSPPVILRCVACGAALSGPLSELVVEADPVQSVTGRDGLPPGCVWRARSGAQDARPGDLLVCFSDLVGVVPCGDRSGCCGPSGNYGPNLACACGAAVATQFGDCYQTHFVVVHAARALLAPADGPAADVHIFAPDPRRVTVWEVATWLHATLGVDDWFGDDLGALVAAWAATTPKPVVIVWHGAAAAAAAGVPVDTLVGRMRMEGAPLRVLLG